MLLPSLYISGDKARAWSVTRAAAYGAVIGALAALFKTLGALHEAISVSGRPSENLLANVPEIAGAALGFALLCAAASALRNFLARRLIWPECR
jgi:hypothetical protein